MFIICPFFFKTTFSARSASQGPLHPLHTPALQPIHYIISNPLVCFTSISLAHKTIQPKMKREGKQHGMVMNYQILPNPTPGTRFITRFDSPPTSSIFTKVSSKPTNHSKFTGKCGTPQCSGCRLNPVARSKNKSNDNYYNRHLDQSNSKLTRLSATRTLKHLSSCYVDDEGEDESVDNIDFKVNYPCTPDEEVGFPIPI